jgi:hypothetical protein
MSINNNKNNINKTIHINLIGKIKNNNIDK